MHHFGLIVVLLLMIAGLLLGTQPFVMLLGSLAVAMVLMGAGLWLFDHYSPGARAACAARDGRIGAALAYYARLGTDQQTVQLLFTALPGCPEAQRALRSAFRELASLEKLIDGARSVDVPRGLLDPLAREVQVTAAVLRRAADRLGVACATGYDSVEINIRRERAVARIDQISEALRAASYGLTELILVDDAPVSSMRDELACRRLRALGDAARQLVLMEERS
jgi:hypothetical protein